MVLYSTSVYLGTRLFHHQSKLFAAVNAAPVDVLYINTVASVSPQQSFPCDGSFTSHRKSCIDTKQKGQGVYNVASKRQWPIYSPTIIHL